jgi:hypothetical protein
MTTTGTSTLPSAKGGPLETRIIAVGSALRDSLTAVLGALPAGGPQPLATYLSLDKVLMSRLLKAASRRDPVAVIYYSPGPDPVRRFLKAAKKAGVPRQLVATAEQTVNDFSDLVRRDLGDRSALDALVSAWLPETRVEFELRRKQGAYRAMSQLMGTSTRTILATVLLHPNPDGESIDIVWLLGVMGMQRLRPGATVKFATRRMMSGSDGPRQPLTLDKKPVDPSGADFAHLRMDEFCDSPPAAIDVAQAGESVHYLLAGDAYGPGSAVDFVMAEVNLGEIPRYLPAGSGRKGYVFAEVSTPTRSLLFDVLVHPDIYPNGFPQLLLYDTTSDGVADVNDRARDIDRQEFSESIQSLAPGVANHRVADIPHYVELLQHVTKKMGWPTEGFRGYRCQIDYPIYGQQVVMTFDPPAPPVK